tara:strand:+ start:1983 stop:2888 length:906 start_codon:yes stop_codon:yes gene_type:complete
MMSAEEISEMRQLFLAMRSDSSMGRWLERRMVIELGFSYIGPLDDRAWSNAIFELSHYEGYRLAASAPTKITPPEITVALVKLEKAGVVRLPEDLRLREQIARILLGHYGKQVEKRFVTAVFIWLVGEDEFVARNPGPWGISFQFLQQVLKDIGERGSFEEGYIQVVGSSGNTYRIEPKFAAPHYGVFRVSEDSASAFICIDPIGTTDVLFGDILVNLVLALYDDMNSARHISTLGRHVFSIPARMRRRNVNIEHLWRRALGNIPEEVEGDPRAMFQQWRQVVDRFQTNLEEWNWSLEEEE